MKGIARTLNEGQKRIRKSVRSWLSPPLPGDDDPFPIRPQDVTLFAEDAAYARYHYQGMVMASIPGVMPHADATISRLKIASMRQRFVDGADWRDTSLFREYFTPKLASKGRMKGATTLDNLADVYARDYDVIFRSIRDHGFDVDAPDPIYVHVLDDGAFCWTSSGNHRLGMALALGLDTMPVRVKFRTRAWQDHRLSLLGALRTGEMTGADLPAHPDLRGLRHRHAARRA